MTKPVKGENEVKIPEAEAGIRTEVVSVRGRAEVISVRGRTEVVSVRGSVIAELFGCIRFRPDNSI